MLVFRSIAVNRDEVVFRTLHSIPDDGAGVDRFLIERAVAQVYLYGGGLGDKAHVGGRFQPLRRVDGHCDAPVAVGILGWIQGDGLGADRKRDVGIFLHEIFIDGVGWIAEIQQQGDNLCLAPTHEHLEVIPRHILRRT